MPNSSKEVAKMKDDEAPKVPDNWSRCHFYMARKKRFCRQEPLPSVDDGPHYCGNHQHLLVNPRKRKRVPCPVDPSHLVFEDMMDKHIPICPKTTRQKSQQSKSFYKENLNTGGHGTTGQKKANPLSLDDAKELAKQIVKVHQVVFGGKSAEESAAITFDDIREALPVVDLSAPELNAGLADVIEEQRIKSGGPRHLHQQASLVGHLRRIGALEALHDSKSREACPSRTVLELGAGRGMAGLVIAGVSAGAGVTTKLILVERGGSRGKAEKILRNVPEQKRSTYGFDLKDGVTWDRIRCDIAHVDVSSIVGGGDAADSGQLVVVAKHLCGVGTDLALKALEPIKDRLSACIFATCCHGACSWPGFVGRDYLRSVMEKDSSVAFDADEFELMRKWSAGSVKDQENNRQASPQNEESEHGKPGIIEAACGCDADTHRPSINISQVVESLNLKCGARGLGRACQRLIDYGRREYLKHVVFPDADMSSRSSVDMLHYVDDDITPQNAALVAYRKF